MGSVWAQYSKGQRFAPLKGKRRTEVLVIGGGMAGLLCTYMLKRAGVDCVLLEANRICGGVTENTTAKLTLQHGLIYSRLGADKAPLYLAAQQAALEEYARLCSGISCDYEVKDAYVYSLTDKEKVAREAAMLNRLGVKARLCISLPLPFGVAAAVCVPNQAQLHPLKLATAIAADLPVYEGSRVVSLDRGRALTSGGEVQYQRVIVATHFPFVNTRGLYSLKLYQHRSYVIALEGAQDVGGMYVDERDTGMSFRNYGGLLFIGGGDHRTGKQGGCWQELERFAQRHYPTARIVGKWATQDCMSLDGVPYIGRYSLTTPDMYVATGFNKWGISSSMVAARVLTDAVLGVSNSYSFVFSPSRCMLKPQLAVNLFHSAVGLLTPTVPRCPHLGCALKYNKQEHSWDCPCHGSRFATDGKLLNNPANGDKHF